MAALLPHQWKLYSRADVCESTTTNASRNHRGCRWQRRASVTDNASSGTVETRRRRRGSRKIKNSRRRLPNTDIIFEWFSILYNIIEWLEQPASTATACCFKSQLFGRSIASGRFSWFIVQSIGVICSKVTLFPPYNELEQNARWKNESICSSTKKKEGENTTKMFVLIAENHFHVYINQNQHRSLGSANAVIHS